MSNFTVPQTATYVATDGKRRRYLVDAVIPMEEAYQFQMPGATAPTAVAALNAAATAEVQALIDAGDATTLAAAAVAAAALDSVVEARTATAAPGGTTGVISATTDFVTVTCDNANKVITLPAPVIGKVVTLRNGGTGYELRTSDPATIAINGGAAADAESAIGANVLTVCRCDTLTTWVCTNYAAAGTVSATEVAAP